MLAKVPIRRRDARSSFAALLTYITKDAVAMSHSPEVWSAETAADEMQHVASFSRARDPVYHYILSWREGESPSDTQAFDAVRTTLTALGLSDNQWVAAVHRNTHNMHAHVAVNRVSPESYKAVSVYRDWLVLDRTCRKIELEQGWLHDKGPHRIEVVDGNEPQIVRRQSERSDELAARPSTKARDFEAWNGRESFQTWLSNEPAQAVRRLLEQRTTRWQDIHKVLATFDVEYKVKGSGAIIVDGTEPEKFHAKASHLGRFASRGKLEARLGPYEGPAGAPSRLIARSYRQVVESAEVRRDETQLMAPRQLFETSRTQSREAREKAWQRQRESERTRWVQLSEENLASRRRLRMIKRPASGRLIQVVAAVCADVKKEQLREEVRQERSLLRAQLLPREPGSWRAWLVQQADVHAAAEELRRLRRGASSVRKPERQAVELGSGADRSQALDAIFSRLTPIENVSGVYFVRDNRTIFCDQGRRIVFHDLTDDYVRAGLALANHKWQGGVYLSGTDVFREKATTLAAEMGIRILDGALASRTLDLAELSRTTGKPIRSTQPNIGQQHSGRLVAAASATGKAFVVIDAGRELVAIRTDPKTAIELQQKIGTWVRAHAVGSRSLGNAAETGWQIRVIERKGPSREI